MAADGVNSDSVGLLKQHGHGASDPAAIGASRQRPQRDASGSSVARSRRSGQNGKDSVLGVRSRLRTNRFVTDNFNTH
jgi:hypothetical protein